MKINNNKKGFSIVIGIMLVGLIILTGYTILEYIFPFFKNTKGIENSTSAYYYSYGGVESALYENKIKNSIFDIVSPVQNESNSGYSFTFDDRSNIIPIDGEGDSEYDKNYNKLDRGDSFNIKFFGNGGGALFTGNNPRVTLKLPTIPGATPVRLSQDPLYTLSGSIWLTLKTDSGTGGSADTENFINSNTSNLTDLITQSGYTFDIDPSTQLTCTSILNGCSSNSNTGQITITDFISNNCLQSECGLSIKILNPNTFVQEVGSASDSPSIIYPYLEYKFETTNQLPNKYITIDSIGKNLGFVKKLKVKYIQDEFRNDEGFNFGLFVE